MNDVEVKSTIDNLERSLVRGGLFQDSLFMFLRKKLLGAQITLTLLAGIVGISVSNNLNAQERIVQADKIVTITVDNIVRDINSAKSFISAGKYDDASKLIASLDSTARLLKDNRLTNIVSMLRERLNNKLNIRFEPDSVVRGSLTTDVSMMERDGIPIRVACTKTEIPYAEKDKHLNFINIAKVQTINSLITKQTNKNDIAISEHKDENGFLELLAWEK